MAHHKHHDQHHSNEHAPKKADRPWWHLHRDWRAWLGLILMLAALAAYILSVNESFVPGGGRQPVVPAAP